MNMMRFNEGGMTSEMLQQAMEAQAANMGQDITGDSFILTGQYSSPVQQEEDGREYVEYQHPDMQEPVKVYGNWNEYAVSQDENGMMLIGDEDYPIMQDEQGNYILNEQKFDDQMTAMTERQGAEAMAREAAQGSTQGASKMENLMEMLQDAQGPQGQGGQYEEGGEIPKYFLGGLFKKRKNLARNVADAAAGNPLSAVGMANAVSGGAGGGLLGMSGIGLAKNLINRIRDRKAGNAQAQSAQAVQGAQAAQANPGVQATPATPGSVVKSGAANPAQIASSVAGAVGPKTTVSPQPVQQAPAAVTKQVAANPRVRTSFEYGGVVNGAMGTPMVDPNAMMAQQPMAAPMQQPMMGQGQVPVVDPNAAVANQAAMMAQPQPAVAQMGMMQDGGKIKQQTMKYGGRIIKAYDEGGKNGGNDGLGDGPFSNSIRMMDERVAPAMNLFAQNFEQALADDEKWAKVLRDDLKASGYSMSDLKEGGVPAHVILADASRDTVLEFRRAVKDKVDLGKTSVYDITRSLEDFGTDILEGNIDVSKVDSSFTARGYKDEDSKLMAAAMERRGFRPQTFESASFNDGTGASAKDEDADRFLLPSALEFREQTSKLFDKQGNYKGDIAALNFRGTKFREDDEVSTRPSENFEGDPVNEPKDPIDPIDPRRTEIPEQKITGQIIPPRQEEIIVRKEEEEEEDEVIVKKEEEDNGVGGGLPRFDLSYDTVNPSDYTGGEAQMATGPFANQTEMDRRVNAITREFGAGGRVIKYSDGGSFPDLNKDGKITMADILRGRGVKGEYAYGGKMRSYENGGETDEYGKPKTMSHEDLYKKYLKSRNKKMYTDQAGVADIIKEQERLFMQRGRKFADGTGYNDLFEYGGKIKNYASGGKVLRFR